MKKLSLLLIVPLFISCGESNRLEPIQKYRGCILIENPDSEGLGEQLFVRTNDSVFDICVPTFDAKNLKAGDTIK
jgi:hypothetical protein